MTEKDIKQYERCISKAKQMLPYCQPSDIGIAYLAKDLYEKGYGR